MSSYFYSEGIPDSPNMGPSQLGKDWVDTKYLGGHLALGDVSSSPHAGRRDYLKKIDTLCSYVAIIFKDIGKNI